MLGVTKMKNKKSTKTISIILSMLMATSMVSAVSTTAFAAETTSSSSTQFDLDGFCTDSDTVKYQPATDSNHDGCFEISNAGQLFWFAEQVNSGHNNYNAELTKSIYLNKMYVDENTTNAKTWTPIGDINNQYKGTFNGNNHYIYGIYINDAETSGIGLFSYINQLGTVKNVKLSNLYLNGYYDIGGISSCNLGTIDNCEIQGGKAHILGNNWVGGICSSNHGTITNCENYQSTIRGYSDIGGICYSNYGSIVNCQNSGSVTSTKYSAGGICAENTGYINKCVNTGYVSNIQGKAGGICGNNQRNTIENCSNFQDIEAGYIASGICCSNDGHIKSCYNMGGIYATGNGFSAGICGDNNNYFGGSIENCFNDKVFSKTTALKYGNLESVKNVLDVDPSAFESGEVTYLLNNGVTDGSQVWYQTIGDCSYPDFIGKTVYCNSGVYTN